MDMLTCKVYNVINELMVLYDMGVISEDVYKTMVEQLVQSVN